MTNDNSLLKKKIKDLNASETAKLEKPLGTSMRPFPMWGTQRVEENGKTELEQVLSVIADDSYPMKVYSDRPYEDVVALAYCDMPVPSMLPLFFDGLELRKPESTNRTQMMIGDPGHGKSFLGTLQGRLRSKESVEVFDCGGKNMNDLLFEMVLDFGTADALPQAIDKRAAAGSLQQMSLALIEQFNVLEPGVSIVSYADGGKPVIDWKLLSTGSQEKIEKAFELLKKISKIEGLDNAGGNALGMNSQYGALVRAFMEGREIVLDEYNKSREGSDNALQTVWQFMIGEISYCRVENPLKNKDASSGPSYFEFKREDTQLGFFVTLTGNKKEDGTTTRSLNKSVYSRLSPQTLPDPDVLDWQHRIGQMMVGLPVSTLYYAFKDTADKDPEAFGEWLMWLRQAKAKVEGTPIPELQETLLQNWRNVVSATGDLAEFYSKWAELTDTEKVMESHQDLMEEIDEEYTKKEGIDFRKIKQHLEKAIPIRPRMQKDDMPRPIDLGSWTKAPKLGEKIDEKPSLNFGTRLVEFLENVVQAKSDAVGKPRLYAKLKEAMKNLRDITLQEGQRNSKMSVEQSLNISSFADRDIKKQAQMAHKVFCDYLRQVDPRMAEAADEEIVTLRKLRDAIQYVSSKDTAARNELFVANRDPETLFAGQPLKSAVIKDAALYMTSGEDFDIKLNDLIDHDDFMASLALPTISAKNLSAVWEKNLRPIISGSEPLSDAPMEYDDPLNIAENASSTRIATTSLNVRHTGKDENGKAFDTYVPVHIFHNGQRNKTVIVGEKVPSKLLAAFREAGVIHIDRREENARAKIDTALAEITRGHGQAVKNDLLSAFQYRNGLSDEYMNAARPKPFDPNDRVAEDMYREEANAKYLQGKSLTDLLVDKNIDMPYPKYLVKNVKKA